MGNTISQIAPPKPALTEHELSDQDGKVFIVTGGASGVGFELSKLLYQKNGTIYVAGRSREKGLAAIEQIRSAFSSSTGKIDFLHVDLDDLTGIKASVEDFMDKEERLDVLWNNAGVMLPPAGTATKQGYELQLGTNCVAPFLFTQLLIPILKRTAASSPLGSVRVCWTGSIVIETTAPQGGIIIEDLEYKEPVNQRVKYAQSKVGNLFLSVEMAKRHREDGIMFLCLNPGNLKTALTRHIPDLTNTVLRSAFYEPIYGAYTELYAGLSPDLTMENTGSYIIPWGRIGPIRNDIAQAIRPANEGGRDKALKFYMWCEKQVANYM